MNIRDRSQSGSVRRTGPWKQAGHATHVATVLHATVQYTHAFFGRQAKQRFICFNCRLKSEWDTESALVSATDHLEIDHADLLGEVDFSSDL